MKKAIWLLVFFCGLGSSLFAQVKVSGQVKDQTTNENLPGASVIYGSGKGVVTDFNGSYSIELPAGEVYTLTFSYVGYEKKEIELDATLPDELKLDVELNSITLREVRVIADVARNRETPVAYSTVSPKQIQEELGAQDLPMILNTTPGVYATQTGGGDGDARINIRGFDQQNIAVMIDGIPVNDMLNRRVFWSNWFGLDQTTSSIQVQRGLGASKLALPAIGGTLNIITTPIDGQKGTKVRQEIGSGNYSRTSFMH
ncbi:MAG: carboxypeptidase-like regulatory domain-containing protein, partial [Cryomorphaceae bacterium]